MKQRAADRADLLREGELVSLTNVALTMRKAKPIQQEPNTQKFRIRPMKSMKKSAAANQGSTLKAIQEGQFEIREEDQSIKRQLDDYKMEAFTASLFSTPMPPLQVKKASNLMLRSIRWFKIAVKQETEM